MKDQLKSFLKEFSILKGDFTLSSGEKSSYYIDARICSLSSEPLGLISSLFFQRIKELNINNFKVEDIKTDYLENDIDVIATLKIKNQNPENNPYYKIWSDKLQSYIYVTATHKILDPKQGFIPVETYSRATKTDIKSDVLYCLITENHQIPIGEYTFWDWED